MYKINIILGLLICLASCQDNQKESWVQIDLAKSSADINFDLLYGENNLRVGVGKYFFDSLIRDNKRFWKATYPKDAEYTDEYNEHGDTLHLKYYRKEEYVYIGGTVNFTGMYYFNNDILSRVKVTMWSPSFTDNAYLNKYTNANNCNFLLLAKEQDKEFIFKYPFVDISLRKYDGHSFDVIFSLTKRKK